jgi:hypothetical protein
VILTPEVCNNEIKGLEREGDGDSKGYFMASCLDVLLGLKVAI